jgi:hypothetical protein
MQTSQMRERFSEVEQCIHNAAELCQMSDDVPVRVRDCVQQLEQQSGRTRQVAEQRPDGQDVDAQQVHSCLTDMEKTGDRALQAFGGTGYVDLALQNALRQARKALSSLKQQLH